uniref:FBA_2 domain-containing protein n=1 Tax=Caenorhabditis tropicalis TaxID=1561998 RepID=A0A1I7TUK2_9PELO
MDYTAYMDAESLDDPTSKTIFHSLNCFKVDNNERNDQFKVDNFESDYQFKNNEFPLLWLPLLAKEHVLCIMNPFELVNLSMTSSEARKTVKEFTRIKSRIKSRFQVNLGLIGEPSICIRGNSGKTWGYSWSSDESRRSTDLPSHASIHKLSETPMDDCMRWYESIKRVLWCQIDEACIAQQIPYVTNWLITQQDSIKDVFIEGSWYNLKYFLDHVRVSEKLTLDMTDDTNSELKIPEGLTRLQIYSSKFLDCQQLLKLKVRNIILDYSILSNKEINVFLARWMLMKTNLDLETFEINVWGADPMNVIMDLLDTTIADLNSIAEMRKKFPGSAMRNGFNIRRLDGKVATVCLNLSLSRLLMMTH